MQQPIIQLKNVTKTYKKSVVLDGISLTIGSGEFLWLRGESGAGKSTLLNIISGLESVTSGEVLVDGTNIASMKPSARLEYHRHKIGYIFQDFYLQNHLTVRENILLPAVFAGTKCKESEARLAELSSYFGITDILKRHPSEISGGQAERVCITRALINNPSILLADEPTNNLDGDNVRNLLDLLGKVNRDFKLTIVIASHDERIADYASRTANIAGGKIS